MPESSPNNYFSHSDIEPMLREVLDSGGEFELAPHGTSMLPLIKEGRDTVTLVKPSGRLKLDDIALYKRKSGQFVLHRVVKVFQKEYDMCGDNQSVPERGVKDSQIIAVVSYLRLNGKLYRADSKKLRLYVNSRRNLKLRRIVLGVKARIPKFNIKTNK